MLILNIIGSLKVKCPYSQVCHTDLIISNLKLHSRCETEIMQTVTPHGETLRDVLQKDYNNTPTTVERRVAGHLAKRLILSRSQYESIHGIQLPAGGQVSDYLKH